MDFFDRMGEKLVTAGKDVTQKAKDLSGTAKLNFDIKAKEDFIEKQYAQIGKLYYEDHKEEARWCIWTADAGNCRMHLQQLTI